MNEIRKRAFVGIVGLVSAGLFSMGCSSSSGSTGGGGSTGAAGHAGSTGAGGSSAGGGTTGTGGTAPAMGCQASDAPTSATIADFASSDGGIEFMTAAGGVGAITTYGGIGAPTYSEAGGQLTITQARVATSAAQYVGLVLYFNGNSAGTDCIDAHTYTGVQFDLSGTISGCTLQYSTNDSVHEVYAADDTKGACASGCYAEQLSINSIASAPPATIKVAFDDTTLNPGSPTTPIDSTKITGIQWQFTIPALTDGGNPECDATLNIDNVKFY